MEPKTTHFKLVTLDETKDWRDDVQERAGKVFATYLYDENRVTHCCEITPSFELYHLYSTPLNDDEPDNAIAELVDEEEARARFDGQDIQYIHCADIAGLPDGWFHDAGEEALESDQAWEEARDDAIEYFRANRKIDIPSDVQSCSSGVKP